MNFLMAFPTHNQRFASSRCHLFDPYWLLSSPWLVQVCEHTIMMNLYFLSRAAEFTGIRSHPLEQFAPVGHNELRKTINKGGLVLPLERNTSEVGHKRFLVVVALDNDLQTFSWPIRRFDGGFVLFGHLRHGRPMFACECF
jgi:hypothetical protein